MPAGPAHQTGAQEYRRFLIACASDERFNACNDPRRDREELPAVAARSAALPFVIIPSTRRRLLALERDGQWMHARTDWGRGRADVVNDAKFSLLRRPVDDTVGTADTVPLWNLRQRDGKALFWDGSNSSLKESVLASALAMGVRSGRGSTMHPIEPRAGAELHQRGSAAGSIRSRSTRRRRSRAGRFSTAHAPTATRPADPAPALSYRSRSLAPIDIASMRGRRTMRTRSTPSATGATGSSRHSGRSDGYVAVPLDGLWLRAPYLHNGSVPSLADLLEPPERRPREFWRGYDVYDPANVGFVSSGPEAGRIGTLHDTSKPGNSNAGHRVRDGASCRKQTRPSRIPEDPVRQRL